METESALAYLVQVTPIGTSGFQQHIGADDIGFDEIGRPGDGTINMAFSGQMHHGIRLVQGKHTIQLCTVADVDQLECIAFTISHTQQGCQIAGIGQFIEVDNEISGMANDMAHHSRADKTGSAGNKNLHIK
ncbi:hypothetical protein D3C81_956480 [compost metagenome]